MRNLSNYIFRYANILITAVKYTIINQGKYDSLSLIAAYKFITLLIKNKVEILGHSSDT